MDDNSLPNDVTECHRLLLAAFKQSVQLEQQVADAKRLAERQAAESAQRVEELERVLDETSATHQELQQTHAATLEELAWYKRWTFGRRRERFTDGEGQGHLFELDSPLADESSECAAPEAEAGTEVKGHQRRKKRKIDWDKLRQIRHEHDLLDEEKVCSCCSREMDRISEGNHEEEGGEVRRDDRAAPMRKAHIAHHEQDGQYAGQRRQDDPAQLTEYERQDDQDQHGHHPAEGLNIALHIRDDIRHNHRDAAEIELTKIAIA